MPVGTINKLKAENGYGFIQSADGLSSYFFHWSYLSKGYGFDVLKEGDAVEFKLRPSKNKPGQQEAFDVAPTQNVAAVQATQRPHGQEAQSRARNVLPYGFVPIAIDHAITDAPVWHDGSSGGELLSGEILCALEALTPLLPGNARYPVSTADPHRLQQWGFGELKDEKQIAEPLRLPDGRVVIAGTSLKGMIRQSLGALTSAPMERVGERHFTYRPNFGHADSPRYVCLPAVVDRQDGEEWIVKVLTGARDAVFRPELKPIDAKEFLYKGGIDGQGILANSAPRRTRIYKQAWISAAKLRLAREYRLPKSTFEAYLETQKVLSSDHIGSSHPQHFDRKQAKKAIEGATDIEPGQLIYVEQNVASKEIVSFGHHYQYRWAYTSSVRCKNGHPRPCLTPHEDEIRPTSKANESDAAPTKLTGARLLFGYVRNDENPIGQGAFERLAGRIAINHAVSDGIPRFLGDPDKGYCIPLKILGQPKPSAWEFYLQQPDDRTKPLKTYGDLPDDAGGELAGRKFYRHQPETTQADLAASEGEVIASDQATLARFICQPGTRFRFTIRFARLRPWELGTLLAVLEPHRLAPDGKPEDYAHKLGLGRPLGMGSVRISRSAMRVRRESETEFLDDSAIDNTLNEAMRTLREKLDDGVVRQWLEAQQMDANQRLGYPQDDSNQTIYDWHTRVRRDYSQLRRQKSPNWSALAEKIIDKR